MWSGIDPGEMCRQHLLGEHKEIHQLVGTINAGRRLGRVSRYVRVEDARERHDALAREMVARGYAHRSPLPPIEREARGLEHEPLDDEEHRRDLRRRCGKCRERLDARAGGG